MTRTSTFDDLLAQTDVVLLDGGMATELEKRGVDTSSRLWSAVAMHDDPDAVRAVHRSYLDAGSRVLVTNSYQAHPEDFVAQGFPPDDAVELIGASARLALESVDQWRTDGGTGEVVVAGSLGPYGAHLADGSEYSGDYRLTEQEYRRFHRPRIEALVDQGITQFAVETQPRLDEVLALVDLLEEEVPRAGVLVSFSLGDPEHLPDGTPLSRAARQLDRHPGVAAIGVNCVPHDFVLPALQALRPGTSKPLAAYPNSGERYDPATRSWAPGTRSGTLAGGAPRWQAAGARLLGGCCRTAPADIEALARIW